MVGRGRPSTADLAGLYVTGSGTLSNELGNEPSLEIAGFCIFPISNTTDEGTCSFTVLLMLVYDNSFLDL